jgi:MFS family permease
VTLVAFEAMAVSTAMPVAAQALGGLREYSLAFSLFLTTSLLGVVAAGGWNDARGPREPLAAGLILFSGGLVVAGTASSFGALLVGRAVSGLGGGLQVVTLYVVVAAVYPQRLQPQVFGVISAAWVLPSVLGPPVAGFLATQVSWRVVFLAVPPIALLPLPVLWARTRALHDDEPDGLDDGPDDAPEAGPGGPAAAPSGPARPDAVVPQPGAVSELGGLRRLAHGCGLALGAGLLQWGLQGGGGLPAVPVVVAGLFLGAASTPGLLPRRTLRLARGLASLVVCRAMFTGTFFGAETFVPLMLVTERGLSPAMAGAALTTGAVGWSVGSYLQGRSSLPLSRTQLLSVGGAVVGACTIGLVATPYPAVPVWVLPLLWAFAGTGMGLAMSSTSVLTLRLSVPGEEGRNSAALQIGDALGSVLGIGVAGAIFAAMHTSDGDGAGVFALLWGVLGGVGIFCALVGRRVANAPRAAVGV